MEVSAIETWAISEIWRYVFVQCVKALLYFDPTSSVVDVGASNDEGDTPLHIASRWGYGKYFLLTVLDRKISYIYI